MLTKNPRSLVYRQTNGTFNFDEFDSQVGSRLSPENKTATSDIS